jgi:hypothetical protein
MTRVCRKTISCAVCGTGSEQRMISSTHAFGSRDLDTRPPVMPRSSISLWVQRCPECGYCASNLAEDRPGAKTVVTNPKYKEQLADAAYPDRANSFLCKAMIEEVGGGKSKAAWAVIHAAWVCDDADKPEQAAVCRRKAAQRMVQTENGGETSGEEEDGRTAILVDLLRRSGQFEQAGRVIEERISGIKEENIRKVLLFQRTLIASSDSACHRIDEAIVQKEAVPRGEEKRRRLKIWGRRKRSG